MARSSEIKVLNSKEVEGVREACRVSNWMTLVKGEKNNFDIQVGQPYFFLCSRLLAKFLKLLQRLFVLVSLLTKLVKERYIFLA